MKILVGLSGGVDSAVAAYILKKQGHNVTCAFMRNWDSLANNDILGNPTLDNEICSQETDYNDAKLVADALGLELLRIDFIKEYWDHVFTTFLKEYNLKGSIHCFSGSVEMAREFVKLGYKIGIGGIITYKNAKTIKEVVKDTDLAYILLETDSPYLAPVPHRGEDNNPKYIPIIADEIASIKGTSSLDIARVTTANAEAVFDFSCEK